MTKFKKGDEVWWIDYCYKWKVVGLDKYSYYYGKIHKDITEQVCLKMTGLVNARDCFATKAEAQKECERRNGNKN